MKEYSKEAEELKSAFGIILNMMSRLFKIEFKSPVHDIANALLFQIKGFEPLKDIKEGWADDK